MRFAKEKKYRFGGNTKFIASAANIKIGRYKGMFNNVDSIS